MQGRRLRLTSREPKVVAERNDDDKQKLRVHGSLQSHALDCIFSKKVSGSVCGSGTVVMS